MPRASPGIKRRRRTRSVTLLAELSTRHAPKRAPFYIARCNHLGKLRSNIHHFAFDDRLQAIASYATGIVKLSSGDTAAAEEHLRYAWTTFDRIGYDVRAASTALALHRATGKARWLHLAEDKLEHYPRSWLARSLGEALPASAVPTASLSKMQGMVMGLVCEGLSTDAMARAARVKPQHDSEPSKNRVPKDGGELARSASRRGHETATRRVTGQPLPVKPNKPRSISLQEPH